MEANQDLSYYIKSVLLQAWRERWPEEKWSIAMKKLMPYVLNDDISKLTDTMLDQALIGSSPNVQLLSYLRHAILTQMITYSSALRSIIRFKDISRPFCLQSLLSFCHSYIDLFLRNGYIEDTMCLSNSLYSLFIWTLEMLLKCLQKISDAKMEVEIYQTLIETSCDLMTSLTDNRSCFALIYIASLETTYLDESESIEQLVSDCERLISQPNIKLNNDLKTRISELIKFDLSVKNFFLKPEQIVDLSCHNLNISINVLMSIEAILTPMNDVNIVVEEIILLAQMQGIPRPVLYCELIRSCFLGIIDIVSRPDELKWAAFTYLKLPSILQRLVQLSSDENSMNQLEEGFNLLLLYVPLLDLADTKYNCECLNFLLHELCNKHSLLTDVQCRKIMNKRMNEMIKPKPPEVSSSNQTPNLILRAEPTVTSILKTLDADYTKNQDSLLGVLCQMMSGKSFELILSAAAATGKLQSFAIKLIKFNEFSKQTSGETSKCAQTRALLFDISFLMLCHITQLYGAEIVVSGQDCVSSYFVQWVVRCLPEDGKYKSLDLMNAPEMNKVDVIIVQLNPGGELKTNLARWNDVCHNAPYAIQEVLIAWEYGAINEETVKSILDNIKSTMCCLPIVIAVWLCSVINVSDAEHRQKPLFMLQHLLQPLTADAANLYFAERSNLMQVILGKIVHELLPPDSIPRLNPSAFLLQPKAPTREVLIETFRRICMKGCIDIDDIHKMDYLLNIGGPQWFCEHLVRDVLRHDRPEDLRKGIGLLYSLFHMDLDNITLCLLHHTLPNLLQSTGPSIRLLTDPRGSSLAKLCVMCLSVLHAMRQQPRETVCAPRGRRRTRTEIQLEDQEEMKDDDSSTKMDITDNTDVFGLGDFLSYTGKDEEIECHTRYDSKDLLNRTLVNLFRLFYGILADKLISPRSNFVSCFILETLKTGSSTSRFIFQFIPTNMVHFLTKLLSQDLCVDSLLHLCDLTTPGGRKSATRVVCHNVRCETLVNAITLPTCLDKIK